MRRRLTLIVIVTLVVAAAGAGAFMLLRINRPRTVADVVAKYGRDARERLHPHFQRAGVAYPPKELALLVFKKERRVTVWGRGDRGWRFIRDYPILAASGHAGPKLREGDRQVPEGVYRIEHLNPNSSYHLSMKVSYPNAFDRRMAQRDGRTNLGGDIFIHGKNVSIGCVAIGDRGIEELFTLVAETGHHRVRVVIAPNDLRTGGAIVHERAPSWLAQLYRTVAAALVEFPVWMESGSAIDVRGMPKAAPIFK
jgi:L,D-transpeptidase catalytic domain